MDNFAEDEVQYATINRSHNTISQPVITELKNKFQYEIQDSSSEEDSSDEDGTETGSSGSTVESGSTIGEEEEEEESSDEDNNKEVDEDTRSIGSAASLLDFSDVNRERRVTQALNDALNPDSMSVCSTDVADIVQRQLAEFSMTLRRQIENDMESLLSKKMNGEYGSQPALPPPTPSRKKHMRTKSYDTLSTSTKRKVWYKTLGGF